LDAQNLYREGVKAVREEKDADKGRKLLTQSLRLDSTNDMAWLWLSMTVADPKKKLECVEHALQINPRNEQAISVKKRLINQSSGGAAVPAKTPSPAPAKPLTPPAPKPAPAPTRPQTSIPLPSAADARRIEGYLSRAQELIEMDDTEGAIEQWVRVLDIQADHEVALGNAVRHLSKLRQRDDVKELVWNALQRGTTHPSVYLTAIDLVTRERQYGEAEELRIKLALLPDADDKVVCDMVDYFVTHENVRQARDILQKVIQQRPNSQKLLNRMGQVYEAEGQKRQAFDYYERAARMGGKGDDAKLASKKMDEYVPGLTDKERGSLLMAVRESFGFTAFLLLMAWQDAGLNLARLGPSRWVGVLIGTLGGYLIVTATSSPQQRPLATWLGGKVPPPPEDQSDEEHITEAAETASNIPLLSPAVRTAIGLVGAALFVVALALVFSTAIGLVRNFQPPPIRSCAEFFPKFADFCK
jgi:tetratricopeptide (TPR) repeat protein